MFQSSHRNKTWSSQVFPRQMIQAVRTAPVLRGRVRILNPAQSSGVRIGSLPFDMFRRPLSQKARTSYSVRAAMSRCHCRSAAEEYRRCSAIRA
jgi:hypothetical protein